MGSELIKHTEAAMSLLQGAMKELVYLPPAARKNSHRIDTKGRATNHLPSDREQLERITLADPLGFLLAVMNGQPVVTFGIRNIIVEQKEKSTRAKRAPKKVRQNFSVLILDEAEGQEVYAKVHTPTMDERTDVAKFLTPYITARKPKHVKGKPDSTGEADPDAPDADEEPSSFESIINERAAQAQRNGNG